MFGTRAFRQSIKSHFTPVTRIASTDVKSFRENHFENNVAAHFTDQFSRAIPAAQRWFRSSPNGYRIDTDYLRSHADVAVSIERTVKPPNGRASFERFEAPLSVFMDWCNSALDRSEATSVDAPVQAQTQLYLAQQPITSLPSALQQDLPIPSLVRAGKGDVYASSIWLGISPTNTPMHKDPNPNLFVQMLGVKRVRLIAPADGRMLLSLAREEMQEYLQQNHTYAGLDGMRGEEMMGLEGKLTDEYIWESDSKVSDDESGVLRGLEATLHPGDGLFIPQGWRHSVRGIGSGLNSSVNWWFR